jgi:hypothetical protein
MILFNREFPLVPVATGTVTRGMIMMDNQERNNRG